MIASYRLIGDTQTVTLIAVCCKLQAASCDRDTMRKRVEP